MCNKLTNSQMNYLDVVRIVAALLVLVGHNLSYYKLFFNGVYYPHIQSIAVIIFFLLSGFLTANSLENKYCDNNSIHNYILHRIIRIENELIIGLIFVFFIDLVSIYFNHERYSYYNTFNIRNFFGCVFLINGTTINRVFPNIFVPYGSARPLWTLSIDFWFSIIFGIVYHIIVSKKYFLKFHLIILVFAIFLSIEHFIGGRGNGLGFVFLLGIFSYYIFNRLNQNISIFIFFVSFVLYVLLCIVTNEAYNIYAFIILFGLFSSGLSFFGTVPKGGGGGETILLDFSQNAHLCYI